VGLAAAVDAAEGVGTWAAEEVAWAAETDAAAGAGAGVPAALPTLPGDLTISESCTPSGMVPLGFAGQLPGGFTGVV
jgi:hypothetical protein